MPLALRVVLGPILLAAGIVLAIAGERAFKRIGTNVNPFQPSLTLASQGIYAHLRNPMYIGMLAAVLGIVLLFGLDWTLLFALAGALVMHFGVVRREERYLERKFGESYRNYKARVPRYGWRP